MRRLYPVLMLALCMPLLVSTAKAQQTFTVDRLTDAGEGTGLTGDLRYCITNAADGDSIAFAVTGTIILTRALPQLNRNIRVEGPGADLLTVRGGAAGSYRAASVAFGATVRISDLTISGGGIINHGTLTVSNGAITDNQAAGEGGGIQNYGALIINNGTISNNAAFTDDVLEVIGYGGGIFSAGPLTVTNSTISNNLADSRGGGILSYGMLSIANSTIAGNSTDAGCGGIEIETGTAIISNSTISGNFTSTFGGTFGGGICFIGFGGTNTIDITNSTVTANRASDGGGIDINPGIRTTIRNTIIAGNVAATRPDIRAHLTFSGYNLIGDISGGSGFDPTDLLNVDPMLGPLQDNGGPTWTHALLPGSPAIDAGDPDFVGPPDFDQRGEGFPRVVNGIVDIGAFEVQVGTGVRGRQ